MTSGTDDAPASVSRRPDPGGPRVDRGALNQALEARAASGESTDGC